MATGGRTFNGTNQYGTFANAAALEFTTGTVSIWVKNFTWNPGGTFLEALASGTYIGWRMASLTSVGSNVIDFYDGSAWRIGSGAIDPTSSWKNLIVKFASGSSGKFFIAGTAQGTFTPGTISTAGGATKYLMRDVDASYTQCEVSEIAMWNTTLSDGDCASIASGTAPGTLGVGNQVGYWKMNVSGATISNQWGSNDLTLFNSPGVSSDGPTVSDPPAGNTTYKNLLLMGVG